MGNLFNKKSKYHYAGFLHDGRARSIEEAILWHGGEAEFSRNAYASLKIKNSNLLA